MEHEDAEKLVEKLSSSPSNLRRVSSDASQIFHDTAGWKSLETYMKCLQSVIGGCGYAFNQFVDQELLDLIFSTLTHTNRFVRETGFYVCSSLVGCGAKDGSACVACGNFVLCFPEESKDELPALYPLFFNNLQDNIPSVRLGAAIALVNVVKACGAESQEKVLAKVKEGFDGLENQPATSEKYSGMDTGPATYSVAKQLRDNDMELHTDRQMYSCGSLAPKMGRGREGGCMDHKFRKPSEPWELADGCVSLMAELSHIPSLAAPVMKLVPLLAKACTKRHYTHHVNFLETVCKQLPNLAKGLGKRQFKQFLEQFLEPIFYSLECDSALTSAAASQCLTDLSHFIGEGIMRGRVEQYDPNQVKGADAQEKLVYQIIKEANNKGIWIRDIRFKSNLTLTQLNKILKNLESKKLIKAVKSVAASRKKVYMLYNLEPDTSVTGGAWYTDQDFESEFVEVLNQQCFKFLEQRAVAAREQHSDPVSQQHGSLATAQEVLNFITQLGISKVQLSVDDMETILNTLIYDGKVMQSVRVGAGGSQGEGQVKMYRVAKPLIETTGLMRMPCGFCPP
nr:hypothetical protein BaRGS_006930 [Batillaria attramentaria]